MCIIRRWRAYIRGLQKKKKNSIININFCVTTVGNYRSLAEPFFYKILHRKVEIRTADRCSFFSLPGHHWLVILNMIIFLVKELLFWMKIL